MLRLILRILSRLIESTISTDPRYRDRHKDSSFLSNFFMAYIEIQSLIKQKTLFKPLNQLFENATYMTITFFPYMGHK